ncbi:hypothetical protein ACWOD8_09755 [Enterococcus plantarum]
MKQRWGMTLRVTPHPIRKPDEWWEQKQSGNSQKFKAHQVVPNCPLFTGLL